MQVLQTYKDQKIKSIDSSKAKQDEMTPEKNKKILSKKQ